MSTRAERAERSRRAQAASEVDCDECAGKKRGCCFGPRGAAIAHHESRVHKGLKAQWEKNGARPKLPPAVDDAIDKLADVTVDAILDGSFPKRKPRKKPTPADTRALGANLIRALIRLDGKTPCPWCGVMIFDEHAPSCSAAHFVAISEKPGVP